jgi:hypothetical protein
LIEAEPLGSFQPRCAYLELLLMYIERCAGAYDPGDLRAAREHVLVAAKVLIRRARSARSLARAADLVAAAERRLGVR